MFCLTVKKRKWIVAGVIENLDGVLIFEGLLNSNQVEMVRGCNRKVNFY